MLSQTSLCQKQSWVDTSLIVRKTRQFSDVKIIGDYSLWLERRPDEGGRAVVVARDTQGLIRDLTPLGYDIGTKVHEYGGGAWEARLTPKGIEIIFSDRKKGGIWLSINGQEAQQWISQTVSEQGEELIYHYADFSFHPDRDEVFCVRECQSSGYESSDIASVNPNGLCNIWARDSDFYAAPRPSPNGQFLAWYQWQNPFMPWDETQLCVIDLTTKRKWVLAGQEGGISLIEPRWAGQDLYALSDQKRGEKEQDRYWSPIRFEWNNGEWHTHILPSAGVEIGFPAWVFGQNSYSVFEDGRILARGIKDALPCFLMYDPKQGWEKLSVKASPEMVPCSVNKEKTVFAWIDVPQDAPPALAIGSLDGAYDRFRLAWELPPHVTKNDISRAISVHFEVEEGPSPLQAFYYPPAQGDHCWHQEGGLPPLVVLVHGGPTGQASSALSFKVQWWTSRGFAVLDVNYRGSTGFGRTYRDALKGLWGVLDVQDCCTAVKALIEQKKIDPRRCVIRGSSAGGLTVLSALASSKLFRGGTVFYGVTDLTGLVQETHRFEARYFDGLIGPWPQAEALYKERSPLSWPEKLTNPVLFLHGAEDRVVPLSQAKALADQMKEAIFHIYPHEGHGFRAPDVIADSLQRELEFYERLFSLDCE
ncbi:prolyl oligopeptidase family serine peptidase [Aristophania vespae]|uniref:Prolyl oligopeptidase family serine peptidase n=1 Tax=Aristophania vespae TaxID=2697033 RepID=A0A6P1NI69_9PROT|nr:prolyl oligopeptidase family serine peptidase [Aristophania vespae]QHI96224.1 prolyl oligopeptidase family serine peptidase [Aristophania vespae]